MPYFGMKRDTRVNTDRNRERDMCYIQTLRGRKRNIQQVTDIYQQECYICFERYIETVTKKYNFREMEIERQTEMERMIGRETN